jgi:hypothetical protein
MGLSGERHVTNDHRVLNRATWSARHGSRMLLGFLITRLVPSGATLVFGADDPVERRAGRKMTAKGCSRDAVRSSTHHVIRGFGLQWVSMMLWVPVPWSRRVWALPCLTALCWPEKKRGRRRHQTRVDGVRQMMKQVRHWRPGRRVVLVVEGGLAVVSLAWACAKHTVVMVSRVRWDAALDHPPGPQPLGKRGRTPLQGKRPRSLQAWAARAETPWEPVAVDWSRGERKTRWGFSRTALWYTPRVPPVAMRSVVVAAPEGQRRLDAFCCPDLQATPREILPWVVRRWSVDVTFDEGRAHLGLETPRQGSDQAIARTTPVLWALLSLVTVLALPLSQGRKIPVPVTAWYHKAEPTFADCLTLVRGHLWRARYVVHSTPEAEMRQLPREAVELWRHGFPLAA